MVTGARERFMIADSQNDVKLYDFSRVTSARPTTMELICTLTRVKPHTTDVAVVDQTDVPCFITSSDTGWVQLWRASDGSSLATLGQHEPWPRFAIAGQDGVQGVEAGSDTDDDEMKRTRPTTDRGVPVEPAYRSVHPPYSPKTLKHGSLLAEKREDKPERKDQANPYEKLHLLKVLTDHEETVKRQREEAEAQRRREMDTPKSRPGSSRGSRLQRNTENQKIRRLEKSMRSGLKFTDEPQSPLQLTVNDGFRRLTPTSGEEEVNMWRNGAIGRASSSPNASPVTVARRLGIVTDAGAIRREKNKQAAAAAAASIILPGSNNEYNKLPLLPARTGAAGGTGTKPSGRSVTVREPVRDDSPVSPGGASNNGSNSNSYHMSSKRRGSNGSMDGSTGGPLSQVAGQRLMVHSDSGSSTTTGGLFWGMANSGVDPLASPIALGSSPGTVAARQSWPIPASYRSNPGPVGDGPSTGMFIPPTMNAGQAVNSALSREILEERAEAAGNKLVALMIAADQADRSQEERLEGLLYEQTSPPASGALASSSPVNALPITPNPVIASSPTSSGVRSTTSPSAPLTAATTAVLLHSRQTSRQLGQEDGRGEGNDADTPFGSGLGSDVEATCAQVHREVERLERELKNRQARLARAPSTVASTAAGTDGKESSSPSHIHHTISSTSSISGVGGRRRSNAENSINSGSRPTTGRRRPSHETSSIISSSGTMTTASSIVAAAIAASSGRRNSSSSDYLSGHYLNSGGETRDHDGVHMPSSQRDLERARLAVRPPVPVGLAARRRAAAASTTSSNIHSTSSNNASATAATTTAVVHPPSYHRVNTTHRAHQRLTLDQLTSGLPAELHEFIS
jgi:hypothetical protein